MHASLWPTIDGRYYADFRYDNAPTGFEDLIEHSHFTQRLQGGTALAEYGEPKVDHLLGEPTHAYRRITSVEPKQICGYITAEGYLDGSGLRVYIKPYGPMQDRMVKDFNHNPSICALKFRYTESMDENDQLRVIRIDGVDFIKLK